MQIKKIVIEVKTEGSNCYDGCSYNQIEMPLNGKMVCTAFGEFIRLETDKNDNTLRCDNCLQRATF